MGMLCDMNDAEIRVDGDLFIGMENRSSDAMTGSVILIQSAATYCVLSIIYPHHLQKSLDNRRSKSFPEEFWIWFMATWRDQAGRYERVDVRRHTHPLSQDARRKGICSSRRPSG